MIEEERRRRAAELEMRRQMQEEIELRERQKRERVQEEHRRLDQLRREHLAKNQKQVSYPPGTIVRGRDGNLYRVVAPPRCQNMSDDMDTRGATTEIREKKLEDMSTEEVSDSNGDDSDSDSSAEEWHYCQDTDNNVPMSFDSDSKEQQKHSMLPAHSDIVVETVPNEEDDELRELHSVWRNRRPSPGQWMEPCEYYCWTQ